MSFSSQGFAPELVKALTECGYEKLTPIQQKAIPMARKEIGRASCRERVC